MKVGAVFGVVILSPVIIFGAIVCLMEHSFIMGREVMAHYLSKFARELKNESTKSK